MKLVWIFAVLPFCLGQVTDEDCRALVDNFASISDGAGLSVCGSVVPGPQCCSQMNETALGMTLNNALNSRDLGTGLRAVQNATTELDSALTYLRISLINDVLRPLMNNSADLNIGSPESFIDDLERITEEVLYNINATIAGNLNANITAELMRFFTDGLSAFYFNASFVVVGGVGVNAEEEMCGINNIFMNYFPSTEQAEIASLGRRLQQITVAYDVARNALPSLQTVLTSLENFNASYTCTNVWTQQYGCPRCAGQAAPLCQGRCNEVLIGCTSSLQQMIVQLNVLLDFTRGSVNSLLSGSPFVNLNVSSIADDYRNIFSTFIASSRDYISEVVPEVCFDRRKRSVDSSIVRHKRQVNNPVMITFPNVTIDQSIVTMISDTLLPVVVNVSLNSDRMGLCEYLMANGQGDCTIGVGNVSTYTSSDIGLEISDQVDNPTGPFNLTQLRYQARPLPYVITELLTNRSDIMMLYNYTLPGRPVPNLDFLIDATGTTTTATPSASVTASPTPTTPGGGGGGGSSVISYSMFITLVALLLASVL